MEPELARTIIETQFPELAPASVIFLGEGFDSCAFEVNNASAYGDAVDGHELARARYLAAYRGVADVKFGRETGRPEYVRAGIRALSQVVP